MVSGILPVDKGDPLVITKSRIAYAALIELWNQGRVRGALVDAADPRLRWMAGSEFVIYESDLHSSLDEFVSRHLSVVLDSVANQIKAREFQCGFHPARSVKVLYGEMDLVSISNDAYWERMAKSSWKRITDSDLGCSLTFGWGSSPPREDGGMGCEILVWYGFQED